MSKSKLSDIIDGLKESNCWSIGNTGNIGLGLALTREFVALHGGEISLQSAPGDGTTVEISLPESCVRHAQKNQPFYAQVAG
jgi:K+-sensing histidine kinase KdpD